MWYRSHRAGVKLGVIRLDYHYPPAPGDVDHPGGLHVYLAGRPRVTSSFRAPFVAMPCVTSCY